MRPDLKQVVTERPRSGGGFKTPKGSKREWQRHEIEDYPKREKIRAKWHYMGAKQFTDVLGPLYGYLLKQVGRPWDKVYSEITQNLPKGTTQNDHIYTHIWQFVERDVIIVDGEACYKGHRIHGVPIRTSGRYTQMYINPDTGLLCKAKKGKNAYIYFSPERGTYLPGIKAYPGVQYHKLNGVWYEVKVKEYKGAEYMGGGYFDSSIKDEVLDRNYRDIESLKKVYGGYYIAVSKRQLKKREIKFNCLDQK